MAREAALQLDELRVWWTQNRPSARPTFEDALASVLASIAEFPNRFPKHPSRDVRYCRIEKTPYLLFFEVRSSDHMVTVVTAWSASLGDPP
ncbi:MAG: type II toxin-antitoxin system RelE/ParE family toxin [Deltaproteobacteria bacterium]|nr:type II toxin-antitoxin system RelE/ParE family toxin [Deltaproteobacteria bacterium]